MKNRSIELKWGVVFALSTLGWMILERMMGWHDEHIASHATYTNFFAIVAVAVYVLALRDKKLHHYGGKMTYRQGFVSGLLITLVVTLLSPLTQYITLEYITPEYFTHVIAYAVESGNATLEEAQSYFNFQNYVLQATVGALIMGVITAAVVAFFMKSKS